MTLVPPADQPALVSVVVPMLDEMGFIETCLDAFAAQTYPLADLEVIVVDGGSSDGSRAYVEGRMAADPWIRVVDNPDRRASSAFNRGVEAARGEVVCLFSSHGVADPHFVERSVEALRSSGAAGVGGRLLHEGGDPVGNAIGLAMVSPVGMASPFRYAADARFVDTIGHPAYRREVLARLGPFDERLERNSDYELNWRLREAGEDLWFDPTITTTYRPRGSLAGLARQFWWYGRWKERVIRRHPRSLRPRHLVPPAAVAAGLTTPLWLLSSRGRRLVAVAGVAYGAVVTWGVVKARPRRHDADPVVMAACFPIMHVAWGGGFLASVVEDTPAVAARCAKLLGGRAPRRSGGPAAPGGPPEDD